MHGYGCLQNYTHHTSAGAQKRLNGRLARRCLCFVLPPLAACATGSPVSQRARLSLKSTSSVRPSCRTRSATDKRLSTRAPCSLCLIIRGVAAEGRSRAYNGCNPEETVATTTKRSDRDRQPGPIVVLLIFLHWLPAGIAQC